MILIGDIILKVTSSILKMLWITIKCVRKNIYKFEEEKDKHDSISLKSRRSGVGNYG